MLYMAEARWAAIFADFFGREPWHTLNSPKGHSYTVRSVDLGAPANSSCLDLGTCLEGKKMNWMTLFSFSYGKEKFHKITKQKINEYQLYQIFGCNSWTCWGGDPAVTGLPDSLWALASTSVHRNHGSTQHQATILREWHGNTLKYIAFLPCFSIGNLESL